MSDDALRALEREARATRAPDLVLRLAEELVAWEASGRVLWRWRPSQRKGVERTLEVATGLDCLYALVDGAFLVCLDDPARSWNQARTTSSRR